MRPQQYATVQTRQQASALLLLRSAETKVPETMADKTMAAVHVINNTDATKQLQGA